MVILALFTILCGAVLAFRFRVAAVLSAIAIVWTMVVFFGAALGYGGGTIALTMAMTAVSLQVGYFAGACARVMLLAARVRAMHPHKAADEQTRRI